MFQNIEWSAQACTLKTFVDRYTLPQLVNVEDGFYSDDDAKTLSAGQIFTLHFTKQTDKLVIQAADHKQYLVPLNCPCKVEILPKISQDSYGSVEDILHAWTSDDFKFIRAVHNAPPSMGIKAGDILKLKKTVEVNRVKFLECEFFNKTKDVVRLNLDFKAAFEPLAVAGQYQLREIIKTFQLPLRVKFTSCDTTIQNANNEIELTSLGSVVLKELRQETTIIATSRHGDTVTVLMIPTDLDVTVFPANGAVIGDTKYARFCKEIHDGTQLTNLDLFENRFTSIKDLTVDVVYDYVEVKPPLPYRNRGELVQSENSDSSDDYDVVEPPPRPPKPPPKPKPKPKPKPNLRPVPSYENVLKDDVVEGPEERPSNFEEASTRDRWNGSNDNLDGDDEDPYFSAGFDSDEDYIYPEIDDQEPNLPSDSELKPSQETPNQGPNLPSDSEASRETLNLSKSPKTLQFTKRLSGLSVFFKKALRSPPGHSQEASYAKGSPEGQYPSPSSSTALPDFQSSPSAKGVVLPQAFPDDLRCLSLPEVSKCLTKLNMAEHVEKFERDQIDGEFFVTLDETMLPYLGVRNTFQQQKLLMFINGWRPKYHTSPSAKSEVLPLAFPDDLRCISVPEVGECLRKLNMAEHVEKFDRDQIDGELFLTLDEAMLLDVGVNNIFQQRKLFKFINGWRPHT